MAWSQWAFFTSLVLWIVIVPFQTPSQFIPRKDYQESTSWPYSWSGFLLTILSVSIMYFGYRRLCLYLKYVSDALATARTSRRAGGRQEVPSEETVMVTRSFVECHNRLASFLPTYAEEVEQLEGEIRANVSRMMEDIESWKSNLDIISQHSQYMSTQQASSSGQTVPRKAPVQPRERTQPEQPAAPPLAAAPEAFDQHVPPVLGRAHKVAQPPKHVPDDDTKQHLKALKPKLSRLDSHLEQLGPQNIPITKGFRRHSDEPQSPSTARHSTLGVKKEKATVREVKQKRKSLLVPAQPAPRTSARRETGSETGTTIESEISEKSSEIAGAPSSGTALIGSETKEMLRKAPPADEGREREMGPAVKPPVQLTSEPGAEPEEELVQRKQKATAALSSEPARSSDSQPVESFVSGASSDSGAQEDDSDLAHLETGHVTQQETDYVTDEAHVKGETPTEATTQDVSKSKAVTDANDGPKSDGT